MLLGSSERLPTAKRTWSPEKPRGTHSNKINGLPQLPKLNVVGSIPIARSN
jgi:hypothetical protein